VSVLNFAVIGIAVITNGPASAQLLQRAADRPAVSVQQDSTARQSDAEERERLAQRIVGDRERDNGREFDPAYKHALTTALQRKQLAMLQEMTDGFKPAPLNLGDSAADLVYTPVAPCRIIDTRLAGGPIAGGSSRNFFVAGAGFTSQGGTSGDCGIPFGPATSVMINFVAVSPQGAGNLKGSAFPNPIPVTGSIVNYQALTPALNIANGLAFPICDASVSTCTFDMTLLANVSGTDVVADVLGYFSRFKKEQVRSFTNTNTSGNVTVSGCSDAVSVAVTAPVDGKVIIRARSLVNINHTIGSSDEVDFSIATAPGSCAFQQGDSIVLIPSGASTEFPYSTEANLARAFSVTAGSTTTFYLAGEPNGSGTKVFFSSVITAEFQPN